MSGKRRVEATVLDQPGPFVYGGWWVHGPGCYAEFDNWSDAMHHATTCQGCAKNGEGK